MKSPIGYSHCEFKSYFFFKHDGIEVDTEKMVLVPHPGVEDREIYIYDPEGLAVMPNVNGVSVHCDTTPLFKTEDKDEEIFAFIKNDIYLSAGVKSQI
jgi:hypothetical protein